VVVAELFAKLGLLPDEGSFHKGHELIEGLHHALEAYVGYEGLKKVGELVEGTVKAAVEAKHLGERLGITGEAVQELGYAADVTGASAEDLQIGMQHLARGMQEMQTKGTGPAAQALSRLGIHMRDLKGESLDQNLEVIANKFAAMPDGANKAAIAMELFGRQGTRLIPLLNKGQAGITDLRNEAEKLGVVIDEAGIEKAEEFEIAQKKLGATLKGIRNEAVVAMLPALQEMAEGLRAWITENREAIKSTLEAVLHALAFAFKTLGTVITAVTGFLQEHSDVATAIIIALGALITAFAVQAAIDWLLAFWPLVLVAALIAGVVLLVKNFGAIWDWVKDKAGAAWQWIKDKASEFYDWLKGLPEAALEWMTDVADAIKEALGEAWDWAVQKAKDAWAEIKKSTGLGFLEKGAQKAGSLVGGLVYGKDDRGHIGEGYDAVYTTGTPEAAAANIQTGDVQINVTNAQNLNSDELASKIKDHVRDAQADAIRQAHSNLAGGRR
jgi:hypothetical protein